jgi:hypothetical protein
MPYVRLRPPDPSFLFFFTHCDKLFARWQRIAGEPFWLAGGKSEHHTAACRVKHAGIAVEKLR